MKNILKYFLALLQLAQIVLGAQTNKTIVCYYDSDSYQRKGSSQLTPSVLKKALGYCTHLVYGYADITSDSYEIIKPKGDHEGLIRQLKEIRSQFSHLKVYLGLGGEIYKDGVDSEKYMRFLEGGRLLHQNFIKSSIFMVLTKYFDGLDLAFQFPRNKPRKVHSPIGAVFKSIKKLISGDFVVDKDAAIHKQHFTEFVNDLHQQYSKQNLSISLTVLPNVNSSWYFDISNIHSKLEFINLFAFDFLTPERNPEEADYTAPIYFKDEQDRLPHYNIDFQVQYWLNNGCPADKLNLGIPTYARTWKTTEGSGTAGAPVVAETAGPGAAGVYTKQEGILSWPEVCSKVTSNYTSIAKCSGPNAPVNNFADLEGKYGNYAFCPADKDNNNGIWFSYDDPRMAGLKAKYAKQKSLGGVAVFELSYDDFNGLCSHESFPILQSAQKNLLN